MRHTGTRRGNYMMTMPFFIPVLIGFAALSVDISYINMAQGQVQHVADAASHAAFVGFRASNSTVVGDVAAQYILDQNKVGNEHGVLVPVNGDLVEYGEWDFDTLTFDPNGDYVNSARAKVARNTLNNNSLNLFFAPILGYNKADVAASGVTAGRTRQLLLVQDVSCSFQGDDIANSKDADVAFLDYLDTHPYPRDMIGMTMFGGRSWYPAMYNLSLVEDHYDDMRVEFLKLKTCSSLPKSLYGTPTYWNGKYGKKSRYYPSCYTTQARGLIQGREQFLQFGDDREFQAIIIISDGEPTNGLLENPATWPGNDATDEQKAAYNQVDIDAAAADSIRAANQIWGRFDDNSDASTWNYSAYGCGDDNDPTTGTNVYLNPDVAAPNGGCKARSHNSNNWDGGVHMWSVYFNKDGNEAEEDWMEDHMVKGLGKQYATTDSTELTQIMIEIASSIPVVLAD